MKRRITQIRSFKKAVDKFIGKNKLLNKDFEEFKDDLTKNPEMGDLIPGAGGVRKTRLKSASKGNAVGLEFVIWTIRMKKNCI